MDKSILADPEDQGQYVEIEDLLKAYTTRKEAIHARLKEFAEIGHGPESKIFEELCFCLLTPQSKARICDAAIRTLSQSGALMRGDAQQVLSQLRGVRFSVGKARWIVAAREEFYKEGRWTIKDRLNGFSNAREARDWLVDNIMGLGHKEAGHFLRNIGMGENLSILDRHIMKNLHRHGVIGEMPKALSKKEYLRIEGLMKRFSSDIGIPLADLDLLFWSRETGEIFK